MPTLADRAHRNLCDFHRWLPGLYSGRILDADGIVAVTAELDWPVNRTAVRTGGTDATAWADAVEAFLFADGHTACVYARVGADDDITEVLTARGFAEMATLPEMVCETSLETRADPAGFRVRLAESADDVAGYASVAGEAFAHLAIPADWLEATLTNPDALLADNIAIAIAEADDGTIVAGALSIVLGDEPNGYVALGRRRGHRTRPRSRRRRHPPGDQ